jgi:CubicO group peptidase (beta-lactamase class C family)
MNSSHTELDRSGRLAANAHATVRDAAVVLSLIVAAACNDTAAPDLRRSLSAKMTASTQPKVDSLLADAIRRRGLPGMVAAVIRDGGIVAQGAAGIRHVGLPDEITVTDRFHLGSNIKAMTSTMIATLVDEGKLQWTSTPATVFPELAASMNPQLANATLERILQHRSGLPGFTEAEDFLALPPFDGTVVEQRRAFAAYVLQGAAVIPGEYLYSNAGYIVAAAMAERVTGKSWEELMEARIFGPLGMQVSRGWPSATDPDQPWGHFPFGDGYVALDPTDFEIPGILGPAGDITMSIQEYAKFIKLNLRALRGHPRLASAAGFDKLFQPNGDYALGWQVGTFNGALFAAHEGSIGVFRALVLIFPTRNIAVAVLVNAGGQAASEASVEVGFALAQ